MLVKVRFSDDTCGTVDNSVIDGLIKNHEIREIRRASGWVRVDREQGRKQTDEAPRTERRAPGSLVNIYV